MLAPHKLVIPKHIAIIMDGNGRWAKARGKLRTFGHKKGVSVARDIVRKAAELGVHSLTLFAFSSENWQRPEEEVGFIMGLFVDALKSQVKELDANNVRLRFIGNRKNLKNGLCKKMQLAEEQMQNNTGLQLNVAISYGGKWDALNAFKAAALESQSLDDIDENTIDKYLQTAGQPNVDLLIRTGGEKRMSNFLLWQTAYAELYFLDTLWPNFSEQHLLDAIQDFSLRQRRFGKTGEQIS